MTDAEVSVDGLAQQIADRGRGALVEQLRATYGAAAAAHADLISFDDDRIEAMVQSAAERADGLQWRRALAGVAAGELGIGVTEALSHPAVARAQRLVGAPSYEQSLAELRERPLPARVPPLPPALPPLTDEPVAVEEPASVEEPVAAKEPTWVEEPLVAKEPSVDEPVPTEEHEQVEELETVAADDVLFELLPEPDPGEFATEVYDPVGADLEDDAPSEPKPHEPEPHEPELAEPALQASEAQAPEPHEPELAELQQDYLQQDEPAPADDELTFPAIHLGGVANLPTRQEGLSVRLSANGLDIVGEDREIIGRLIWDEIEALEVPNLRALRRRQQLRARLVVRTQHGDASFEVPEISADELRERVEPFMRRYGEA